MNDFEQQLVDKVLESIQGLALKVTEEVGEIRGDIKAMTQKNESEHKALRSVVERNISIDTERLNKHSEEIDDHSERLAKLEEWKEQFQKQIANRIAISQSIATVAAVVIAFLLSKYL